MVAESPLSRRDRLLWALLLVAACLVVYANGLTGDFTYDDKAVVRDNIRIRSPRSVGQIFTTSYFGGPRGTGSAYRPVLLLSYAAQYWVHGREVAGFHAVNLLLHAAATLLLAGLLLRIGIASSTAAAASLLFAVEPVHVEAVTSLVGRGETQTAVFVLLYLHCAISWLGGRLSFGDRLPPSASRLPALLLALPCYAAAILTKESGAVAPALAFLLAAFVAQGPLPGRLRFALVRGWPLWLLCAVVLGGTFRLRAWVLGGTLRSAGSAVFEVENPLAPLSALGRIGNACVVFFRYVGRCLFPLHLSGDESAWSIRALAVPGPLTAAAVLLLVLLAAVSLWRLSARSPFALGFLFFAVAMLPTGNLLFPIGTILAERIAYLPSVGACLILGAVIAGGLSPAAGSPRRRDGALLVVALLFSARTVVRNAAWWTDEGLFRNLIATAPASAKAHYDLAYILADRRPREARTEYQRAIAIYEPYWDAWAGKGRAEKDLGLFVEAEKSYEKSIAANGTYENGYYGLGLVREARGDDSGAQKAYREGLRRLPDSLPLAYRVALLTSRLASPAAAEDWRRALRLGKSLCSVRSEHARWLWSQGRSDDAARQAREALSKDPRCAAAWRVLAARAAENGYSYARALALEKAYRATKSAEDLAALEAAAGQSPSYAIRFAALIRRK